MKNATILVSGKVQGVWFRDHVKKSADKLNLYGWVKNNPDGTVSAEVEGEKNTIEKLIEMIRAGSPMSMVADVTVQWKDCQNKYISFNIIR